MVRRYETSRSLPGGGFVPKNRPWQGGCNPLKTPPWRGWCRWHHSTGALSLVGNFPTPGNARFPTSDNGRPGPVAAHVSTNGQPPGRGNETIPHFALLSRCAKPPHHGVLEVLHMHIRPGAGRPMCKTSPAWGFRGFAHCTSEKIGDSPGARRLLRFDVPAGLTPGSDRGPAGMPGRRGRATRFRPATASGEDAAVAVAAARRAGGCVGRSHEWR
jgi:hypothetical protein